MQWITLLSSERKKTAHDISVTQPWKTSKIEIVRRGPEHLIGGAVTHPCGMRPQSQRDAGSPVHDSPALKIHGNPGLRHAIYGSRLQTPLTSATAGAIRRLKAPGPNADQILITSISGEREEKKSLLCFINAAYNSTSSHMYAPSTIPVRHG